MLRLKLVTFLFLIIPYMGFAQSQDFDKDFTHSFYKNFRVSNIIQYDTIGTTMVPHIYIRRDLKNLKIELSDNANEEFKKELSRIQDQLNLQPFMDYLFDQQ